ncbi:MAG: EscU/YscU/HrcU family type III secretion system export apparatus switch protein [Defluviitaleaceae bacterium]|nr:EscU/YscU/HrcU family type III secretion system export apparatus switch protein [Defluviitaleaceae bacterium]MCL2836766.1 EscU/YscU/HrcU family type III secretion system export apparatus switch protein [Defluviitaleaceae bacterium]
MNGKDSKDLKDIKKQKAVALKYELGDFAPKVVASGQGFVAERIIENAETGDIPIYQDSALADELTRLNLGDDIPPELYEIVAQVLIYVSDLDKKESLKRNAPV